MRLGPTQLAVGFAALLVGMMIAVQVRLQQIVPPPTQTSQLLTLLKASDNKRQALNQEVAHLQQLLNQRLSQAAAATRLNHELTQAEILAGTIPVHGPGIQVVWSNGNAPQGFQIADIDLLLMVNELRAAGAEAISINGQRITALTEIREASNYVLINDSQQDAPFTIDAIGNPSTLEDALTLPGGLADESQQAGRTMKIQQSQDLNLPAGSAAPVPYASPPAPPS